MSYNIDTFKLKKLENLKIPLNSFFVHPRKDWHPGCIYGSAFLSDSREQTLSQDITIALSESCYVKGSLADGVNTVSEINWTDEGSGTGMNWVLEPALKESTGELIASCIWEGGDSINRLVVKNGVVSWEDIEL